MSKRTKESSASELFDSLTQQLARFDPVSFAENHLTIDGKPFNMSQGTGYKYLADAMRYIVIQAENKKAKPVVILKGRQVGATILAAAISLYFATSGLYGTGIGGRPPIRILHLFPTIPIMSKYTKDKLEPMMRHSQNGYIASKALKADGKHSTLSEDTLTEKTFIGDNKIRIDAIGKDADRIRGLTQDCILFDECQDMMEAAIENALRILTAAQYGRPTQGVQMFFGTPKESGSKFWKLWQDSDQRFFHLGCAACHKKFKLYDYGKDSWKDIWVEGHTVKCPHCGVLQDKRLAVDNGEWIPDRDPSTARYAGFHMNIMIDPRFTREMVEDFDPKINPNRSERAWKNETLGEFYSSGGSPLTMEDIIHNALDITRGVSRGIRESSNKIYTLGIDWGDKSLDDDSDNSRGQSFTAMAVLSCDHNGAFTVENAFRLKKNNPSHRIRVVEELFERYRINNAAADYYHGRDIVEHFQVEKEWKSKLLACHNSGTLAKTLSFDPKQTRVTVNKDLMVEEVFGLIRAGRLKFPVKGSSWDQLLWLMQHCASMETKMVMKTDNYIRRYVKGAIPNDGLMAIMYALVAYKFIITQGFSIRNTIGDENLFPQPLLAYAPNLRV
jgi:hypothetical protein